MAVRTIAFGFYAAACALIPPSLAQRAELRTATPLYMPAPVDSNSPAVWNDGQLVLFNSSNVPLVSRSSNQFLPFDTDAVSLDEMAAIPVWMEAAWKDDDGTIFAWYHHEPAGVCSDSSLTAPIIGAMVSYDGGNSFEDLGPVLTAADVPNCHAQNGFFAGGHGDFSVVIDRDRHYFYFLFSNYGGDGSEQGIAVARMNFTDRFAPAGTVTKYFEGDWTEPGLGGRVTPLIRVTRPWQFEDADAYWGPSVHWNSYLQQYVMLLNHACCGTRWPQKEIAISYSKDLITWTKPVTLLDDIGFGPGYYPQVLGSHEGETDTLAGELARFYVQGVSHWEIIFHRVPAESSTKD